MWEENKTMIQTRREVSVSSGVMSLRAFKFALCANLNARVCVCVCVQNVVRLNLHALLCKHDLLSSVPSRPEKCINPSWGMKEEKEHVHTERPSGTRELRLRRRVTRLHSAAPGNAATCRSDFLHLKLAALNKILIQLLRAQ